MSIFYAASTGGFYDDAVHVAMPDDAVEITAKLRSELLAGEAQSLVIGADENGRPVLKKLEPDVQAQASSERIWRDSEIESIKWLRERHRDEVEMASATTLSGEQYEALLNYLKLLRDWPQSEGFPDQQARPVRPDWLASQTR
ncbi:phage tail assembly chaperone [Pseudomonas retamae]|uniref:Phage tail assembly chaperone n=1 Tax=Pseudomonas retamae TaxID=702110 RepID=A0ABW7DBW3_9PSED